MLKKKKKKTPCFQCRGHGFDPWLGNKILHAMWYSLYIYIQVAVAVKNLPANAGDVRDAGSIPGPGRSPGGGHSNPL